MEQGVYVYMMDGVGEGGYEKGFRNLIGNEAYMLSKKSDTIKTDTSAQLIKYESRYYTFLFS